MSERVKCPTCGGYGTIDPDDADGAKALAAAGAAPGLLTALEYIASMEFLPVGDANEEMSSRLQAARAARQALAMARGGVE